MFKNYVSTKYRMMNHSCILVLLQMVKKEATDIPVAEQGEAEWPYCALLDGEGMHALVQPLVMAGRQSCSLRGNLE